MVQVCNQHPPKVNSSARVMKHLRYIRLVRVEVQVQGPAAERCNGLRHHPVVHAPRPHLRQHPLPGRKGGPVGCRHPGVLASPPHVRLLERCALLCPSLDSFLGMKHTAHLRGSHCCNGGKSPFHSIMLMRLASERHADLSERQWSGRQSKGQPLQVEDYFGNQHSPLKGLWMYGAARN